MILSLEDTLKEIDYTIKSFIIQHYNSPIFWVAIIILLLLFTYMGYQYLNKR